MAGDGYLAAIAKRLGEDMAGDGYVAAKAKRIGPQNNPMIRLGLEPRTPNLLLGMTEIIDNIKISKKI